MQNKGRRFITHSPSFPPGSNAGQSSSPSASQFPDKPSHVGRGSFVQLDNYNPKYLPIFSREVLKRIASGDESWDEMVPPQSLPAVAVSSDRRNVKPDRKSVV